MAVITVADPSLVVLVGAAGSGKSTLAARHFDPSEVLSSDALRAAIAGDEADQTANGAAFKALHRTLERRLGGGRLTVVDATNLTPTARRALLDRARAARLPATAIVLDLDERIVLARNAARSGRVVPEDVVRDHLRRVRDLVDDSALERDGFEQIVILWAAEDVDTLEIRRAPLARPAADRT